MVHAVWAMASVFAPSYARSSHPLNLQQPAFFSGTVRHAHTKLYKDTAWRSFPHLRLLVVLCVERSGISLDEGQFFSGCSPKAHAPCQMHHVHCVCMGQQPCSCILHLRARVFSCVLCMRVWVRAQKSSSPVVLTDLQFLILDRTGVYHLRVCC